MRDRLVRGTFATTFALVLLGAAAAGAGSSGDLCVGLIGVAEAIPDGLKESYLSGSEAPAKPVSRTFSLEAVEWTVEAYGPVATGSVRQVFVNREELPVMARLVVMPPYTLSIGDVDIELETESFRAELSKPERSARGKRKGRHSTPSALRTSQEFRVAAGSEVVVEMGFQLVTPFGDGAFQLELPKVATSCGTDRRPSARGRESRTVDVEPELSVRVTVHHESPLGDLYSPSHLVAIQEGADETTVWLERGESLEDDGSFQLDIVLGAEDVERAAMNAFVGAPTDDDAREVMLLVTPPATPREGSARAREVVFVLDSSGSMKSGKLEKAKEALAAALRDLDADASFNIVDFDSKARRLSERSLAVSSSNLGDAEGWLEQVQAEGGTQLAGGLTKALERPEGADTKGEGGSHRLVVVLTDGNISDEGSVLKLLEEKLDESRLLLVGIGQDMNPRTLQALADFGRGEAVLAPGPEELGATMESLLGDFSAPIAWDLALDWGEAEVSNVRPKRIPDLYSGRPVTIFATVRGPLPSHVRVLGADIEGSEGFEASVNVSSALPAEGLERPARYTPRPEKKSKRRR